VYIYNARLINVVDGDTLDLEIDLGFGIRYTTRVRLARINTPELNSKNPEEREKAKQAKNFVIQWFKKYNNKCIVKTLRKKDKNTKGKYGRYIVYILDPKQKECLNTLLIQNNLAAIYE
jgi:micrococcal nuclease